MLHNRKGSHSVFSIRLHLVFVTHYRRKAINADVLAALEKMFNQVCLKMDCQLIEFSGESDHVHLLIDLHPKVSVSSLVGSLKSASGRRIKRDFPEQYSKFYSGKSFWSGSYYAASTGGAPIEKVKKYIKEQEKPS